MSTITFECPICKITRTVDLDTSRGRGIICASVSGDDKCPHNFIIFTDTDLNIRRIQRVDHIVRTSDDGRFLARGMSLRGARKVFGDTLVDIISCILLKKPVLLCDDPDVSITLYNTLARIFQEPPELGRDVLIIDDCDVDGQDVLVVNCRYSVVLKGNVPIDAHKTLGRFIDEAVAINDNEAAVVFVRQRISALQRAAEFLVDRLELPLYAREVLAIVEKSTGIRLKYADLHAVRLILRGLGQDRILRNLIMGDLDEF